MATVTLQEPDRPGSPFPDICMKCGRPAPERTVVRFRQVPRVFIAGAAVGVLLGKDLGCLVIGLLTPILVLYMARNRTTLMGTTFAAPLCGTHSKRLFKRFWPVPALAAVLLCVLVFAVTISNWSWGADTAISCSVAGLLALGGLALILSWFHCPRVVRITDWSITLARVSPAFVKAYEECLRPVSIPDGVGSRWEGRVRTIPNAPPASPSPDQIQRQPD